MSSVNIWVALRLTLKYRAMKQKVVITGIGTVTSIGVGRENFWNNLLRGECGISEVESFDTGEYNVHRGGEVKTFRPEDYIFKLNSGRVGRSSQLAVAAARLALTDAGAVEIAKSDGERIGVSMGTTSGEPKQVERYNDAETSNKLDEIGEEFFAMYPCHMISENIAREFELSGPNILIPTACAAGNYALAYAFDCLTAGKADMMLAGGSDCFSRITFTGFGRLGAIAPEKCQPFDRNRKGMIPGEGAAVLVLETLERARQRGARIYSELAGYGLSCDAHHMTAAHPEGDGAVRAMKTALKNSRFDLEQINYINAHGTGTQLNDKLETVAIKRLFREQAYRIPVSSIKSMLGHTMGAASAIESAVCSMAIYYDRVPPTINLEEPDPECDLDYVPNFAREYKVNAAMNNAYAFGGNNSSLIFAGIG